MTHDRRPAKAAADRPPQINRAVVLVKDTPAGPGPWQYGRDFTLSREREAGTMSGVDAFAVAAACELSPDVTAVTMGPSGARGALRESLALGAGRAVHVCDERLHGADARTTAAVLARAATRLGADVVLVGRESSDGRMGVLGGMLAEILGWPLLSGADRIRTDGRSLTARVREGTASLRVAAALPAVCTVAEYGATLRTIDEAALRHAFLTPIRTWTATDLGWDPHASRQRVVALGELTRQRQHALRYDADVGTLLEELRRVAEPVR